MELLNFNQSASVSWITTTAWTSRIALTHDQTTSVRLLGTRTLTVLPTKERTLARATLVELLSAIETDSPLSSELFLAETDVHTKESQVFTLLPMLQKTGLL